ncbi:MAG: hypothetical protein OXE47_06570, partial [Gammaproteobacteria bacterium]|nr:hypothetical protein [Gammaproteobacteria bacterium]
MSGGMLEVQPHVVTV